MPDTLYHYTDAAGLLGILQDEKLWCTSLLYLNDSMEWRHGIDLYRQVLKDIVKDAGKFAKAAKSIEEQLTPLGFDLQGADYDNFSPGCFVACFSDAEDDLGQWRAYSQVGSRFALGFKADRLEEYAGHLGMTLSKVDYLQDEGKAIIRQEFETELEQYATAGWVNLAADCVGVSYALNLSREVCSRTVPLTKNPKFGSEREWRLASPAWKWHPAEGKGVLKFRARRGAIVPYAELSLPDPVRMLNRIFLGPGSESTLSKHAVRSLVRRGVEVIPSKVPYRDM